MFDDNPTSNSNSIPSNLPLADNDDIFDSVDEDTSVSPGIVNAVDPTEENFTLKEETPFGNSALDAGVLKPKVDNDNFLEFRKHLCWYLNGFPGAASKRQEAVKVENWHDVNRLLEKWLMSVHIT